MGILKSCNFGHPAVPIHPLQWMNLVAPKIESHGDSCNISALPAHQRAYRHEIRVETRRIRGDTAHHRGISDGLPIWIRAKQQIVSQRNSVRTSLALGSGRGG